MKQLLFICMITGMFVFTSCVKSTSSQEYDSVWRPYSNTSWSKPSSGIENFIALDGGFRFDANISLANTIDTLAVKYTFIPSQYVLSNIESGSNAQLTISTNIASALDSMKLKNDTTRYSFFQFGKVRGIVRTFGIDSILTQPRSFASNLLYSYMPSIRPDSCSRRITVQLLLNWNNYTGVAVVDTLKTTKISVQVKNMVLTVSGIDILK